MSSQVDEVIEEVGAFGKFQIRLWVLVSLLEVQAAWALLLPVFAHLQPTWICSGINTTGNGSDYSENECHPEGDICNYANFTSETTSIKAQWGLLCQYEYIPSLIITIQMVGMTVGSIASGQLADIYGRRKILYIVFISMSLFQIVTAFSPNWQVYAVFRFFTGFSIGGLLVVNFVLPIEYIGKSWRTLCGCIGAFPVGIAIMAPLAYFIRDWRHLSLTCGLLGFPLLISWWWVPESPRWLLLKGRDEEAKAIFKRVAECNNKPVPEFDKLSSFAKEQREHESKYNRYGFWDLFRTKRMSINSVIIFYSWFVASLLYYGINLNVGSLLGNRYINFFLMGIVELPALYMILPLSKCIGRRHSIILYFFICGGACFSFLFLELSGKMEELPAASTALSLLGKSGVAGGWVVLQISTAELFPTLVRNIGTGSAATFCRIGGILSSQIINLNKISPSAPFIFMGCFGLMVAGTSYFLPETLRENLPDVLPPREVTCCYGKNKDREEDEQFEFKSKTVLVDNTTAK